MHNELDDECMESLGEYAQDNEHLECMKIGNRVTDKGVEILSKYLIGNTKLEELSLSFNQGVTDASVPFLIEFAKKSSILRIDYFETSISDEQKGALNNALRIPTEDRDIPIKSNAKSAAKISSTSSIKTTI